MDQIALNWQNLGWTLAAGLVGGTIFAMIVRWVSKKHWIGQTAWAVVVGVGMTLGVMIPFAGLQLVAIIFCYFAATGLPMIIEYLVRIQEEIRQDQAKANGIAKRLLK